MTDRNEFAGPSADVLIAEDEPELANLYAAWMDSTHEVSIAHDGREAVDSLDESIDLLFLDRRMPGYSGDEVLEHVRSEGYDIQVVLVSAVVPDYDVLDVDFDMYLVKPVDIDDVRNAVDRLLARRDVSREVTAYYRLLATKDALQSAKREPELRNREEYAELEERIEAKRSSVAERIEDAGREPP